MSAVPTRHVLGLCLLAAGPVAAQQAPAPVPATGPITVIDADRIEGVVEERMNASGDVRLYREDTRLSADRLTFRVLDDELEADGHVQLVGRNYEMDGPRVRLRLADRLGYVERPAYRFYGDPGQAGPFSKAREAHGKADRISIDGENQFSMTGATYSTCKPGDDSWYAKFSELSFDYDRDEGEGWGARVVFKDVPIFYTPYINFPLSNERRSGFLAPTFGNTTLSGLELAVPYYWDIAPNYDATITPHYYGKRGNQLGIETRYLGESHKGDLQGDVIPDDRLRSGRRWSYHWRHAHDFGGGLTGSADVTRVSDDFYYKDLATQLSVASQTQVPQTGRLGFGWNGLAVSGRVLRYQSLQPDPTVPLAQSYELMPQVVLSGRTLLAANAEASLAADYTLFQHPDPARIRGQRTVVYPRIAFPFIAPGYYLTPRIGLHATRYSFADDIPGIGGTYDRAVPIMSLDTGLVFEREAHGFGRRQLQTLEPRLYYVHVPYRDQTRLINAGVNFDSSVLDFNFAQIFSDSPFSGHDRIADADQLTAAITSRLIDEASGKEYFRAMIGQRFFFEEQRVVLNAADAPRTDKKTDVLGAVTGELLPDTFVDAAMQYNPRDARMERFNFGARYQPEQGKVFNAIYRFARQQVAPFDVDIRNVDFSAQWPVFGRWQTVGRYNFSVKESRVIETLAGVQYTAGCWSTRLVAQRFATSATEFKTALFLQLELADFGRLGSNPLDALSRSIPGYSRDFSPTQNAGEPSPAAP
jgi:LPS-assembly protein